MGKSGVTVRNTTGIDIKIQEGNAGVFVTRQVVKNGATYTLKLDPNATYREYVLIRLPDNTALEPMFSSSDVAEFKEILVKKNGNEYSWEGSASAMPSSSNSDPQVAPQAAPQAAPRSGFVYHVNEFFGRG